MIEFVNVTKKYYQERILSNFSFAIPSREMVVLIGPSGCGKTTTLKMINKLIAPTSGKILFNGIDISTLPAVKLRRKMGYVIQQTGLFPHMTVRENIEIILRLEKHSPSFITRRTDEVMDLVGLSERSFLDRYPSQLSGGQQQRVGVARAFATDPDVILMDEPFSALDPITRADLQDSLSDLQNELGKCIVFVTHDMTESLKLADKICLMNEGQIMQYDTPENILRHPSNDFVAKFVGHNRIWDSPELIKVKDIMIDDPVTCYPALPILKGLEKMRFHKVDSLLVIDKPTRRYLGLLRAKDIGIQMDRSQPASKIMIQNAITVDAEQSIMDVFKIVNEKQTSCLPVVSIEGILLGLITKSSLVTTLSQQYFETGENGS